jgi:para-aminobenzoate synthetase component 1
VPGAVEATEIAISAYEAARRLRGRPGVAFLDSSRPDGGMGRYSYVASDPTLVVASRGRRVELSARDGQRAFEAEPWVVLQEILARQRRPTIAGLPPFQGGALGRFGYDLGRHLERLPVQATDDLALPEFQVGLYDWLIAEDHVAGTTWLVTTDLPGLSTCSCAERRGRILEYLRRSALAPAPEVATRPQLRSCVGRRGYLETVGRAKAYIAAGDIYQVNLSHRLEGAWRGDPWALYERLRRTSPVAHGAYLTLGDAVVLSASPERFLWSNGQQVETRPIKGTRRRGTTPEDDRALAAALQASEKDRAENLMIVDLLRNDLGRVCRVGSVRVPELFGLEGYANVWHLVSTVRGELRPELDVVDLLRACFPGGSVTGCPKIRAMEIIEELEPVRRGIYCGAIGYLGWDGALNTSIVIRTLVLAAGRVYLQVGGAVVADSDPEAEYAETLDKARAGLDALDAEVFDDD